MMKSLLLAAIMTLTLAGQSLAWQAVVPPAHHRANIPGGYCTWASATTLARYHGYRVDLVANRQATGKEGPAYLSTVSTAMWKKGIPHHYHPRGTYIRAYPSVVSLRWGEKSAHSVLWTGRSHGTCYYIDPNKTGVVSTMPAKEFRKRWYGNAIYR